MRRSTEGEITTNQIVNYEQFNRIYNEYKSVLNGGISRIANASNYIDNANKKPNAFHRVTVISRGDIDILEDAATGSLGYFRGLSYNTYGGSWLVIDEFDITDMKDGFLQWEYSFHYFIDVYYAEDNPKRIQIQLLVDGVSAAEITPISKPIGSFRAISNMPISGGKHTITVRVRLTSPSNTENNENAFHIFSQKHLFIGRWR